MPNISTMPSISGGLRQQRAAQIRAEMEAKKKATEQQAAAAVNGAEWHAVKHGETLNGIAAEYGVSPEQIWNDPLNKQLRNRRGNAPARNVGAWSSAAARRRLIRRCAAAGRSRRQRLRSSHVGWRFPVARRRRPFAPIRGR